MIKNEEIVIKIYFIQKKYYKNNSFLKDSQQDRIAEI